MEWSESLEDLPDNPNIIQRSGKSFTLSASSLGVSWDPFYHDWKQQYESVQNYLETAMIDAHSRAALASLAKTGKVYGEQGTRTYNPEVLKHIQPIAMAVTEAVKLWHSDEVEPVTRAPQLD